MSEYSPKSPLDFLSEEEESAEEADTFTDDQLPESGEIEESEEEEEVGTADFKRSVFSPFFEKSSSGNNSIMDVDPASDSSSSSDDQMGEENALNPEHENSSTDHTSSDSSIARKSPSRSIFILKPRALKMENISFTPELPAKQPFNDVEEDDCHRDQTMRVEGKAGDENPDDEEPKNESNKPSVERLGNDEGEEGGDVEIATLKGILDYYSKNGEYPFSNSSTMADFIKHSVQSNVSPLQLTDGISELRRRYMNIQENEILGLGPCEQEKIGLAKAIWGNEVKNADYLVEFHEDKKRGSDGGEEDHLSMYPFLKESLELCKNPVTEAGGCTLDVSLGLIGKPKLEELNEKWRNLKVEELELFGRRLDLILEQTKLVLESIKVDSGADRAHT